MGYSIRAHPVLKTFCNLRRSTRKSGGTSDGREWTTRSGVLMPQRPSYQLERLGRGCHTLHGVLAVSR